MAGAALRDRLPTPRGKLYFDQLLAPITWFRVGGPAEVLFAPEDEADVAEFLNALAPEIPVTVIGVGSNLLVRDGGLRGVVIRLGASFAKVSPEPGHRLRAGAAALDLTVAKAARDAGLAGLEFMSGIPGAVGGGLVMNAGAYGGEFKDVLIEARALDRCGAAHVLTRADMNYGYRTSRIPSGLIFVEALFEGRPGPRGEIEARMTEIATSREASQPIRARTGGSTFKNPPGTSAWKLIDAAGCRGLVRGGAQVSEQHCNFLINRANATAADLEMLGEEVRARVKDRCGVELEWEIKRIGEPAA